MIRMHVWFESVLVALPVRLFVKLVVHWLVLSMALK